MEKQPQPVFSQNRRKLSENEREKMYKESPRPQNGGGGGNYLVVNILRNFSHLIIHLIQNIWQQRYKIFKR